MPKSLLFIPDISGFTKFVAHTEVNHQEHILKELLEILIDANDIGLELAEVEGDALFYYKVGEYLDLKSIAKVIKNMYVQFHSHLQFYDKYRICRCGACEGAIGLNIKFIVHYGEISFLRIKGRQPKPHGKEVITVHRLLKNDVDSNEYALFSENALTQSDRAELNEILLGDLSSAISYDYGTNDIGSVSYRTINLNRLQKLVKEPSSPSLAYKTTKPIKHDIFISADPKDIIDLIMNFDHRLKWINGINEFKYEKGKINRAGIEHLCVIDGKNISVETIKDAGKGDTWIYGEKTDDLPLMSLYTYYRVEPKDNGSHVQSEFHFKPKNIIGRLIIPLVKGKFNKGALKNLLNLKELSESDKLQEILKPSMEQAQIIN